MTPVLLCLSQCGGRPLKRFGVAYFTKLLLVIAAVSLSSGCAIKSVASYDETTDKNITALQRKFEAFLIGLQAKEGLPECAFSQNAAFYTEAKVDLSSIKVRAEAIPKNDLTNEQLSLLTSSLHNLEMLHRVKDKKSKSGGELKCMSADEITPLRSAFNSSFTAILKLELAKKRN